MKGFRGVNIRSISKKLNRADVYGCILELTSLNFGMKSTFCLKSVIIGNVSQNYTKGKLLCLPFRHDTSSRLEK